MLTPALVVRFAGDAVVFLCDAAGASVVRRAHRPKLAHERGGQVALVAGVGVGLANSVDVRGGQVDVPAVATRRTRVWVTKMARFSSVRDLDTLESEWIYARDDARRPFL